MKILIIEDDEAVRQILHDMLELNDHTVLAAADGPAGVELAKQGPDLVICDIGLPGMDGHQVFAAIQELPVGGEIPFIFLTARSGRETQRQSMALGADDFITKPFTERDILDSIEARVRRLRPLRERIDRLVARLRREAGANWSHELLTPLVGVFGGLELIEAEADNVQPGELKELLGLIRAGAERQLALSKKLMLYFELERLKTGSARLGCCDAPASVIAGADRAAKEAGRSQDLRVRCDPGQVRIDQDHLGAAVAELTANAFRFSQPGQSVTVTGTRQPGRYRIDMVDQGVGMTAEQCAAAAPFVQFERDLSAQQGLGLGLAIAESVAEVAGGRLDLQPGPGARGLQATLDLPCA